MLSVCGSEVVAWLAGRLCDYAEQICSTDAQRALVMRREDVTRKKPRRDCGIRRSKRFEKSAN